TPLPHQMAQHSPFNVENIGGPAAEVAVFTEICQGLGDAAELATDCVLRSVPGLAYERLALLNDDRAFKQLSVGCEDLAELLAEIARDGMLPFACFAWGGGECLADATQFSVDLVFFDMSRRDALAFCVKNDGRADGYARRNGGPA